MVEERAKAYAESNTLEIRRQLGFGIHGRVYAASSTNYSYFSAIKAFEDSDPFERELAVYRRLNEQMISEIKGFQVPKLLGYDRKLEVIEISLVERPFCLDFASAYLDELPSYFPPFDENWHREKEDQFGAEKWPEVLAVLAELESLGIFQTDVSPSNIAL
ncbi:MAG: hypothetical protein AAGC68_12880 [Verrucomicrobiota bacterium]